jgi:transposase InsO family protein
MIYYPTYTTQPKYINNQAIVEFRIKVIRFYEQYGLDATLSAFNLSRATLFLWRKRLREGDGKLESLAPISTRPITVQKRRPRPFHEAQIIKLRDKYPRIGKDKLKPILDKLCSLMGEEIISESTIGRILGDLKASGRMMPFGAVRFQGRTGNILDKKPRQRAKKLRRGGYYPKQPGDLVQVDCVTKFINGIKRYIISAIDYQSSFAYSYTYKTLNSNNARDFFIKLQSVAPFEVARVQTDNGQEFHRYFMEELDYQQLVHFWNYPRTPKSNGKIERYNRTIQEEFVDYHLNEMAYDLANFNYLLTDWLIYYNTRRPHYAHQIPIPNRKTKRQIPPLEAYCSMLQLTHRESNMLWTQTRH